MAHPLRPIILLLSVLVAGPAIAQNAKPGHGEPAALKKVLQRLELLEVKLKQVEGELAKRPKEVNQYGLPKKVTFCGRKVDITRPEIRDRIHRELMLVLRDRVQVGLWYERSRRVFPIIERHAKELGACTDLKYVAVIESGLRSSVTSRASAKGWWQFMAPTGRQYGLKTFKSWDERADLDKATRAGLTYLKTLEASFGSYPLALAAYNTGPGRLRRQIERQGVKEFWRLDLYREAERYVPRTIAIKLVLSSPEAFGFYFDRSVRSQPVRGYVKMKLPNSLHLPVLRVAKATGVDYRTIRQLNPEIGADNLPRGIEFVLTVPAGKEPVFRQLLTKEMDRFRKLVAYRKNVKKRKRNAKSKAKSKTKRSKKVRRHAKKRTKRKRAGKKRYRIKSGDTLWSIATRHDVSVGDLRRWNRLKQRSILKAGDLLIVRKGG